ncbi:MAG TPA: hypothetical protein VJR95_09345 [Rhodanobacter sp.]|nr:hypothetical protein [Rhodanobacter sp.]
MSATSAKSRGLHDRRLFVGAALGAVAIVFAGFARTYFLRGFFFHDPLPLLLHIHGAVMFAWFVLFFVQTCLVETNHVSLHRRLGVLGATLAVAMLILGPYVAFHALTREVHGHTRAIPFFALIVGFDLAIMLLFAVFVACAIALRRTRTDFHKRLMLLATLSLLAFPIARFQFLDSNLEALLIADLCVLLCVAYDTFRHHRLHPAFAIGAPAIFAVTHLAYLGFQTQAWIQFATGLVS